MEHWSSDNKCVSLVLLFLGLCLLIKALAAEGTKLICNLSVLKHAKMFLILSLLNSFRSGGA